MPTPVLSDLLLTTRGPCKEMSWQRQHAHQVNGVIIPQNKGADITAMIKGWLAYADNHKERYEGRIGDDGVLGKPWAEIGVALHQLLNGETGTLDCRTASSAIIEALQANSFDVDGERIG